MNISSAVIETKHVGLTIGRARLLHDITLSVQQGEILCIVGPSGAGKSTLLRTLNLLHYISEGVILMCGRAVVEAHANGDSGRRRIFVVPEQHRRRVGMVFQEFNLWEDRDVLANLTEGPRHAAGVSRLQAEHDAREILERFQLLHLERRLPAHISGGERQRVALIRALLMKPEVLLLDEITSALDPENIASVHDAIRDLAAQGMTMVLVTHHIEFARRIASRVAMLDQGQVVESGTPDQVLRNPLNERTIRFIHRLESSL